MRYIPRQLSTLIVRSPDFLAALRNISWLATDRVVQMALGLTVGAWVARYLGPEQFGLLSFATAVVAIFSSVSTAGLEGIAVREIVRRPHDANTVLGSAFSAQLIGGLAAYILAVTFTIALRPGDSEARLVVAIIGFGSILRATEVMTYWFESHTRSKRPVLAKNANYVAMAILKIWLILIEAPLLAFVWLTLLGSVSTGLSLWFVYRQSGQKISKWHASVRTTCSLLSQSWPLALSGVTVMIQARLDQVMLGSIIGDGEVGQYSVAMQLIDAVTFIPVIIVSTFAPHIVRAKAVDRDLYHSWLLNVYRLMVLLFLAIAAPTLLFGEYFVLVLFGPDYARAGALLPLFVLRLFFAYFGIARTLFIMNEGLFKHALVTTSAGTIVNALLNYMLIPAFQSEGAIVAAIASFAITIFIVDAFRPDTRINFKLMLHAVLTPSKTGFMRLLGATSPPPTTPAGT